MKYNPLLGCVNAILENMGMYETVKPANAESEIECCVRCERYKEKIRFPIFGAKFQILQIVFAGNPISCCGASIFSPTECLQDRKSSGGLFTSCFSPATRTRHRDDILFFFLFISFFA